MTVSEDTPAGVTAAATPAADSWTSKLTSNYYIIIAIVVVLIILLLYKFKPEGKKEKYNKNRSERDDPQGDWSLANTIKKINDQQAINLKA